MAVDSSGKGNPRTLVLAYNCFAFVVDSEPDGPSWQITHDYGPEASIHAAQALVSPYHAGCAEQALVHLRLANVDTPLEVDAALGLEFRLDDIERAGYYTRSKPSYRTSQRVELGVGSIYRPALET